MRQPKHKAGRAGRAAPFLSALLMALLCLKGLGAHRKDADAAYLTRVAAAIDAIPYRIGPLVGTDTAPTPAAIRLLRPNRILERHYIDPESGDALTLLFVHCADVHDMLGHYPPICYPAHGWLGGRESTVEIPAGNLQFPASVYRFSRSGDEVDTSMTVLAFFVLPGAESPVVPDMDALARAGRSPAAAGLGAAQVQILIPHPLTAPRERELTGLVLRTIQPAIRTIAAGPHP